MGCLVERYRDELARGIPEVAGWFGLVGGPDEKELVRLLGGEGAGGPRGSRVRRRRRVPASRLAARLLRLREDLRRLRRALHLLRHPGIKGPYHAASPDEILREADACLERGAKSWSWWGRTPRAGRAGTSTSSVSSDLLAVDPRLQWLRVMYLQPEHVTDGFLAVHGSGSQSSAAIWTCPFSTPIRTCCAAWAGRATATPIWNCSHGRGG